MKQLIEKLLQQALSLLVSEHHYDLPQTPQIIVERPRDSSHGDFSSNLAMVLAKPLRLPPRQLAEILINLIPVHADIETVNIAGPGFINFTYKSERLVEILEAMSASPQCGVTPAVAAHRVVVDYSSPNLAKEMHVGHLRSTIIGDALAKILAFKGYDVIRQNHVGDWGTQFGMLLAHWEELQQTHADDVALQDLEGFYKAAKTRFDNEPGFADRARQNVVLLQSGDTKYLALWSAFIHLSLSHCQAVYDRLGVSLTASDVRAESAYNDDLPHIVSALGAQKLLVEDGGAKCVFMDEFKGKNDEPIPIIVQKKDGGFLYASTDLAAILYRARNLHAKRVLYVVDARQALHFQQVFALAHKAGFAPASMHLEHIGFGMVLDKSGKPFKSREGGVTKLTELLDEAEKRAAALIASKQPDLPATELQHIAQVVGISAVKYADLSKNRLSDYVFDWDSMINFEGNTAPYLLYAYTRVNSLLAKGGISAEDALASEIVLHEPQDLRLIKQLLLFPEVIDTVVEKAMPHFLCTYLFDLAGEFSSFYEACPILNQDDTALKASRLKLAALTAKILQQGLALIGISVLSRM